MPQNKTPHGVGEGSAFMDNIDHDLDEHFN